MAVFLGGKTSGQEKEMIVVCLRTLYFGQIGIVVAMSGYIGQESLNSTLRATLLSMPSRINLFLRKMSVVILGSVFACMLSGGFCLVAYALKYQHSFEIGSFPQFIFLLFGAMISWIAVACISASLSMISQSMVLPIAALTPLFLGFSQMLLMITEAAKYLPDLAAMNLFLKPEQDAFPSVGLGITIQLLWLLLFGSSAMYLFCKRDVR
jgi:ABC-type transport system involved in multi-copper enzyme maturation permease subunit